MHKQNSEMPEGQVERAGLQISSVMVRIAAVALWLAALSLPARPDDLATVRQALEAKYALTTTTADKTDIVTAGDVLVLEKSDLLAVDIKSRYPSQNKYANGHISQGAIGKTTSWLKMLPAANTGDLGISDRTFVSGEKLWLTGIDVRDTGIVLTLFSDPYSDKRFEARLSFPFDRGLSPSASQVLARVAEVFNVQPVEAGAAQQTGPAAAPIQAEPKRVGLQQTPAQVTAILGQPEGILNSGTKQIYTYRDLKITFVGGKVADIQ